MRGGKVDERRKCRREAGSREGCIAVLELMSLGDKKMKT